MRKQLAFVIVPNPKHPYTLYEISMSLFREVKSRFIHSFGESVCLLLEETKRDMWYASPHGVLLCTFHEELMLMEVLPFLPLLEGLCITSFSRQENVLVLDVLSERLTSCCPLCASASGAVHSQYRRTLRDVPCGGQAVRLSLGVRKFFCYNPDCSRKIFTERLPIFVEPWAQMTFRLVQAIQAIGLSTSGSLGARLAARLGISTSWMTILRRIMDLQTPVAGPVTVLGIDDFSFRRGRTFGTILVDLELHQVIDVLPERSSQTSADWMRDHPEIAYVSRDRGKDYTQGATQGAPQATQISDRFHLMKNFVEAVDAEVSCCYKHLRQAQLPLPSPDIPQDDEWQQAPDGDGEQKHLRQQLDKQELFKQVKDLKSRGFSSREIAQRLAIPVRRVYHWQARENCPAGGRGRVKHPDKHDRFEQIRELWVHGLSQKEIAQRLGMGVRTVQRWQKREEPSTNQSRRKRRSIFDPYVPYVLLQWQQGRRDIGLIFQEIQNQGFKGSIRVVYRFVKSLRQQSLPLPAPSVLDRISVQKAIWLIARSSEKLKADERIDLQQLCQTSQELRALHTLAQSFGQIVRQREGYHLHDWMRQVATSSFRHVQRFAQRLQQDKEEVLAGLTLIYSNGQVEGQVNKLKLLKRTMYGRAGFPLLRQRVLHAL